MPHKEEPTETTEALEKRKIYLQVLKGKKIKTIDFSLCKKLFEMLDKKLKMKKNT